MGLLDWMERTTERLNQKADDAGVPSARRASRASVSPEPERGVMRELSEEDINGFLEASGQKPDPRRMNADEFMRVMRTGGDARRLRRIERDLEWLRREARLSGVPVPELRDVP
jgi:hypothetical protein